MSADEKFFAWLDGELSASEAAEMEGKIAADPQLARLAEQHRAMGARLRSAFDTIAEAPVPEHIAAPLREPAAQVVAFAAVRSGRARRASLPQWAAIAATLVAGVLVGTLVRQPANASLEIDRGGIYAAAALDRALDDQLASAPTGDIRIGLTFREETGVICRSFTGAEASGLACRDGDRWRVRGLFATPEGQSSEFRMAAGMDPHLAALIDSTMVGEPLDAVEERAAMQGSWR
jgi:hypothetical protein